MEPDQYLAVWLVFVNIKPLDGFKFHELIETKRKNENYIGAWANILVRADTIHKALEIIPRGLKELNFEILFIDKIENFKSLVDYKEIAPEVIEEADWLLCTSYVFKISDKIFPYEPIEAWEE
jgi:hypothetical protein